MSHQRVIHYSAYKSDGEIVEERQSVSRGEKVRHLSPPDSVVVIAYTPITGQYELISEKENPTAKEKKVIDEAKKQLHRKFDGDVIDGA